MDDANKTKLSNQETEQLLALLQKYEPGFLPFPVFRAITRLVVTPIIELVPLRKTSEDKIEVLLLARGPDDPIWPNEMHTPGTVIRTYDFKNKTQPFNRIINDELRGTKVKDPVFVTNILGESKRGIEQAQIFYAEVVGEPKIGQFFPVDALPEQIMESQISFIEAAAIAFKQS